MTRMIANGGTKIDAVETATAVPVSTVDTTGFAKPPVVAVDVRRPAALAPFMALAVPPPAIMASDQVTTGSKLATVDTMTAVPAMAAKGRAILSNALSTHGMKYANISTMVAKPRVNSATVLPIHVQLSLSSQTFK